MPHTKVQFYQEADGTVPVKDWLRDLQRSNRRAFAKCVQRIQLLAEHGHELRRPHADLLRDGIYELRIRDGNVNYRILYFFHGRNIAVLAHALTKQRAVPPADIERAIHRKSALESNPAAHVYEEHDNG